MARIRGLFVGVSILLVIVFTLFITTPALADAETPPEATPVVEETPIPTEEVLPTEEATAEPSADPTEAAAEETGEPTAEAVLTGEEVTPEQALVEVLAENDLVLADENGDAIPLASEAASELAEGADPYFMAGGVYIGYRTAAGTCAAVVLPANCNVVADPQKLISTAVTEYSTTYAATATGAIFIEAGSYTQAVNIDVNTPNLTGLIGVGSSTTSITFNATYNLRISNTIKGFTLQGLTINGSIDSSSGQALVDFNNNTGVLNITDVVVKNIDPAGNGDGIEITNQSGNVTLKQVESTDNSDEGAYIQTTGNVTITNAEFDLNEGVAGSNGLEINSTGTVTLSGVSVSENYAAGAVIYALKGVKVSDSVFEKNGKTVPGGGGLKILSGSAGAMALTNVYADDNYGTNILIEEVNGVVTLTGIKASYSDTGYGIWIDTCNSPSGVCTNTVVGSVTLKDVTAESNANTNVVVSSSGAITVTDLIANYNNSNSAAEFYNNEAKSAQAVSISNGEFTGYYDNNLTIESKGNVTLNHVTANSSATGNGITIDNTYGTGSVTLLNTLGDNETYGNEEYGLSIKSKGTVTINQIDAGGNDYMGVYINNTGGTGGVVVKNTNVDYNNEDNAGSPSLYVFSKGAVTLTTINANYGLGKGIYIHNQNANSAAAVTITDAYVEYNDYAGIEVFSKGLITLTNVTSDHNNDLDNANGGVYLYNIDGTGGITINNSSSNYNYSGWTLNSNGAVLINTINAYNNDTHGLIIYNYYPAATSPAVTVKYGLIRSNGQAGLLINSKGLITLTSTRVYNNNTTLGCTADCNAVLDNTYGSGGVTFTGTGAAPNEFYNTRESSGVKISTNGTVNLNYLVINNNDLNGLLINNSGTGTVTVSNISSSYNVLNGIVITAKGSITINNPTVQYNAGPIGGISLNNSAGTGSVTVQRSGTSCWYSSPNCSVYDNDDGSGNGYGIFISSKGTVTVKNVNIYYHPQGGIYIDNATGTGSVVLASVISNYSDAIGLFVNTNGTVTVTDAEFFYNDGGGIYIDNDGVLGKTVSITRANVYSNASDGIRIYSKGAVTLAGIMSSNNTGSSSGLFVDNHLGTGGVTITYSGTTTNYFNNNSAYGINLITNGPVIMNKTEAFYNPLTNIWLNNLTSNGSVTMNTVTAYGSTNEYGIYIRTHGSVSLTGVVTYGNSQDELNLSNVGVVTITNSSFDNSTNSHGMYVLSESAITLTNVSARWNDAGAGAYLSNMGSSATPGITVQNSGSLMNEFSSNLDGLTILTKGPVKIVNTEVHNVDTDAIHVDNTGGTAGVTLTKVTAESDLEDGIYILTKGAVTATTISASGYSEFYGLYIDNCRESGGSCTGAGNVTLTNVTAYYTGSGLTVLSNGAITVSNLTSYSNYPGAAALGYGAYLDNHLSATNAAITVKKANVYNNDREGLYILTEGLATIDGITASYNNGDGTGAGGVFIDNTGGIANVVVSAATGVNNFSWNYSGDGLRVLTNGTITATKITADYNQQNGLYLRTNGSGKAVTLNTVTVRQNGYTGITAYSTAASTFTNVRVYDNGMSSNYDGIMAITNGTNLTLTGCYVSGNGNNGLDVTAAGATVYVKSSFYFGNGRYGSGDIANIDVLGATLMIS